MTCEIFYHLAEMCTLTSAYLLRDLNDIQMVTVTVLRHLYALLTVSLVLGFSSRLTCSLHKTSVACPLSAPLIPLPGLSPVINSLLTYLLTMFGEWR